MSSPTIEHIKADLASKVCPAFTIVGGRVGVCKRLIIGAVARAHGNTPSSWEAAVHAVCTGPDWLNSLGDVDFYLNVCAATAAPAK